MLTERNTTKTPHPSGRAATLRMPSGSFASSTSCRIYSSGGWIRVIRRRKSTSISFPRNVRLWSCGKSRSLSVFNRTNPLADIVLPQAIPARVRKGLQAGSLALLLALSPPSSSLRHSSILTSFCISKLPLTAQCCSTWECLGEFWQYREG